MGHVCTEHPVGAVHQHHVQSIWPAIHPGRSFPGNGWLDCLNLQRRWSTSVGLSLRSNIVQSVPQHTLWTAFLLDVHFRSGRILPKQDPLLHLGSVYFLYLFRHFRNLSHGHRASVWPSPRRNHLRNPLYRSGNHCHINHSTNHLTLSTFPSPPRR